jgi:peptidyl-prolyl cis-trans isomerase C
MRSLLAAGLLAGVAATAVLAQDKPYDATTVLATVNGDVITLGHVIALRDRLPPQYQQLPDDVLMSGLVDQLVDQQLLAAAESTSTDTDPLGVRLHLDNERRGALAGLAAEAALTDAVDDAKVQAAYDREVAAFQPEPEFSAAHILVDSEEKAKELKAEIDGGADFAEVAKANSSDGSAASGGDLGWFGPGQMVPEFEAAVTGMEVGQVAGPVQSQFGWHLIKLNDKRESAPPTLEEARPEIENQLRQQALEARLEALRAEATIDRPETETPPAAIRESDLLTN